MDHPILQVLKQHRSIRDYKADVIEQAELEAMLEAAQHASSSNFVQAYSVLQVTEEGKRKDLARLADNERQILSAPVVLLLCADFKRLDEACQIQGETIGSHNLENFIVATVDTALFAQNLAIAAEAQGYGICYIGGVRNEPEAISDLFDLPEYVFPLFAMTIGRPDEDQEVKPRLPLEAILHQDTYDTDKYKTLLPAYDERMADYYRTRRSNQKEAHWSKEMAAFLRAPRREHMEAFIRSRGFDFLNKK